MTPICPYCGRASEVTTGAIIYHGRPDLAAKKIFACFPCGAWVGCHENSGKPLGRLADAALRRAKMQAHQALDPLWHGTKRRAAVYRWLAGELGIDPRDCHIGMFDIETCQRVIDICTRWQEEAAA